MRICRFLDTDGAVTPGAYFDDGLVDLRPAVVDHDLADGPSNDLSGVLELASMATNDDAARGKWSSFAATVETAPRLAHAGRPLEAPIDPPNYLAIGLNYRAHVAEGGRPDPTTPVVFNKQITSVTGPGAPIHVPAAAPDLVDYEGELAVVIGRRCRRVPRERALEVIGGYTIANDISVRDWQRASPTMTMGKSWDTHGPIGPWIVTPDEIEDPQALGLRTLVDGEVLQSATTAEMIFDIGELIEYLSAAFTLLPGTVIATGTPEGVGVYREPRAMLHPGHVVRVEIDGIGVLENPVIAEPDAGVVSIG